MSSEAGPQVVELEVRGVVVGLFRENCWVVGSRQRGEACVIDPGDEPEEILALGSRHGRTHYARGGKSRSPRPHHGCPRHYRGHRGAVPDACKRPLHRRQHVGVSPQLAGSRGAASAASRRVSRRRSGPRDCRGERARHSHPGHTPGSLCLYAPDAGLLFSGDTLFRESIGRTDLPGGDTEQILRSISQRLFVLPDDTRVLPGHMQETTIAYERAHNPFVGATR